MIPERLFDKMMRSLSDLTGRRMEGSDQRDLTYAKLNGCNPSDFQQACDDDDLIEEVGRYGLNYAVIRKYVSKYRGVRETEEERLENLKLMKEVGGGEDITQSEGFKEMIKAVKSL